MTKKEKEIQNMMPLITGKKVKIWLNNQLKWECTVEGTVEDGSSSYIILKWVTWWNGNWFDERMINISTIKKIQLA